MAQRNREVEEKRTRNIIVVSAGVGNYFRPQSRYEQAPFNLQTRSDRYGRGDVCFAYLSRGFAMQCLAPQCGFSEQFPGPPEVAGQMKPHTPVLLGFVQGDVKIVKV